MASATEHITGNPDVTALTTFSPRPNWGAIWAGVFTFIAIWSVFGLLGMAIFASAANPNAAKPVSGMSFGMSVWAVILSIIAMGEASTGVRRRIDELAAR